MTDAPRRVLVEVADPSYGPGMDPTEAPTAAVDPAVVGVAGTGDADSEADASAARE